MLILTLHPATLRSFTPWETNIKDGMEVQIKGSKTDQFRKSKTLCIARLGTSTCSVQELETFLKHIYHRNFLFLSLHFPQWKFQTWLNVSTINNSGPHMQSRMFPSTTDIVITSVEPPRLPQPVYQTLRYNLNHAGLPESHAQYMTSRQKMAQASKVCTKCWHSSS